MTTQEIQSLLEKQRAYYRSGATIPVKFRIEQLRKLYEMAKKYTWFSEDIINIKHCPMCGRKFNG